VGGNALLGEKVVEKRNKEWSSQMHKKRLGTPKVPWHQHKGMRRREGRQRLRWKSGLYFGVVIGFSSGKKGEQEYAGLTFWGGDYINSVYRPQWRGGVGEKDELNSERRR